MAFALGDGRTLPDFGPRANKSYLMEELGPVPPPPAPTALREFVCMIPDHDYSWPKTYYIY